MTTTDTDNITPDEEVIASFDERVRALPVGYALDESAGNELMLNSIMVTHPYLTGELPYHAEMRVGHVDTTQRPIPSGGVLVREFRDAHTHSRVVAGDGWLADVRTFPSHELTLSISARDRATATGVVQEVKAWQLPEPEEPARVDVTFVHRGRIGAVHKTRRFDVTEWPAIRRNYVTAVQAKVDRLVACTPDTLTGGRLLLLHGPPGTGKTTLLRALALAWKPWCDTRVVLDPEVLFTEPGYLFDTVLGDDDDDEPAASNRWRLFVVEDCDELIRAEAKERTGQALSRLLNIADGLVGQGTRVLICLTTNEAVGRLHPAVRRPGRCLAEIEVPRFDRAEARAWLGGPTPLSADGASLAELFAMASGALTAETEAPVAVGQYL